MNYYKYLLLYLLLLPAVFANGQDTSTLFEDKSNVFVDFLADSTELPSHSKIDTPEKYYWPYVIARFEQYGIDDEVANNYIRLFAINNPNHLSAVGAIRVICKYPECVAVRKNMQLIIKSVFDREDSYNLWTGEGTESHISMSRTSAYLFAQKAQLYGRFFPNSKQKMEEMKEWILDWSSRIYEVGTAEFNSGVTEVYSLLGWLNLYDFAEDEEVRLAARAVLDYYASEMALHYFNGFVGGVEMHGAKLDNTEESASFHYNWLWFNADADISFEGNEYVQLIYATTSSYRVPQVLIDYALNKIDSAEFYLNSKPSYLLENPSYNKHLYYRSHNFTLGSQLSAYGGWTEGSSKIVNWKLMVSNNDTISEVRGNGVYWNNYEGLGRDPWTQWGQDENILIQLTKVPSNANELYQSIDNICDDWNTRWKRDFKKRFGHDSNKKNVYSKMKDHRFDNESYFVFPDYLSFSQKNGVWFVDFGSVYMAVVGIPTHLPTYLLDYENRKLLVAKNDPGKICGFVSEIVDSLDFNNYDEFKDKFIKEHIMYLDHERGLLTYESMNGKHFEFLFQNEGSFLEPILDWGYGVKEPLINQHLAPYKQPEWLIKNGTGRVPALLSATKRYNYNETWSVFSGPVINLDQSVLKIEFEGQTYQVDYSSNIPVFMEE